MWTLEDPSPELGPSFCILTFRKHAYNITFGNWHFRESAGWITERRLLLLQLQRWIPMQPSVATTCMWHIGMISQDVLAESLHRPDGAQNSRADCFALGPGTVTPDTSQLRRLITGVDATQIHSEASMHDGMKDISEMFLLLEQRCPVVGPFKLYFVASVLKTFARAVCLVALHEYLDLAQEVLNLFQSRDAHTFVMAPRSWRPKSETFCCRHLTCRWSRESERCKRWQPKVFQI